LKTCRATVDVLPTTGSSAKRSNVRRKDPEAPEHFAAADAGRGAERKRKRRVAANRAREAYLLRRLAAQPRIATRTRLLKGTGVE